MPSITDGAAVRSGNLLPCTEGFLLNSVKLLINSNGETIVRNGVRRRMRARYLVG